MIGRLEVARLKMKLDATFSRVSLLEDLEVRADFARYLCVLVSGFLENAAYELFLAYTRCKAAPPVRSYVQVQLERLTNLNSERLLQLTGAFDAERRANLETFINGRRGEALNSIIALRHNVAHGGVASVSYVRVRQYYDTVIEIVDYLADLLDPLAQA